MTNIIRFVGSSGSGKTTLIAAVVRELTARGRSAAVIKHAHHAVELDVAGKDSRVFTEAGATSSLIAAPGTVAMFRTTCDTPALSDLARGVSADVDIVLAEGFHDADTAYFHVLGPHDAADERMATGELLAYVPLSHESDETATAAAPAIAGAIIAWLDDHAEEIRLNALLREAQEFHGHLCPGQVLGVRLAMLGAEAVGLPEPRGSRSLIVWVEIDRCGADAVQTVTGCKPGKRTLKLVDHGKLAATFLNTGTGQAVRVIARADSRERAAVLYPALDRKQAQTLAYRTLPLEELFDTQHVAIELDDFDAPGKPLIRVTCTACKEEVSDFRHVDGDDGPLCRSCAGRPYYRQLQPVEGEWPW
jgi:formylmethanofuran dehydrogenase subunit E